MRTNPVRAEEWALLVPCLAALCDELRDTRALRMLELGNKLNTKVGAPGGEVTVTYKEFFTSLGYDHTSVDINGQDGALPIDLRKCLRTELVARGRNHTQFDVVTNIGTTEHVVDNQEAVWRNVWEAVRPGGWLLSITPKPGQWRWHGLWYPRREFYAAFAELNSEPQTVRLGEYGEPPRTNLYMVCRKSPDATPLGFTYPGDELLYRNHIEERR